MGEVLTWQQQDIEGAVRDLVAKHFTKAVAHNIMVTPDTGHYGDPILRIRIPVVSYVSKTTWNSGFVDHTELLQSARTCLTQIAAGQ